MLLARTGWKPKKNLAQSNALGTVDYLFCALKEQKEGGSVPTANNFVDVWVWILFSFCAYSAPVCLYIHTQSVALGYILIGASPRLCSNVNSQIICSFAQSLPIIVAVAQCHVAGIIFNRVHCISTNTGYCILASTDSCMLAKTGWKPKKNLAQSNALGTVDYLFCALKEQKEGGSVPTANNFVDVWVWFLFSFCAYSAPVSLCIFTQGVALGYIPIGASPRLCSNINSQIICGFAPSLLVTSATQYLGLCSYCDFAPSLLKYKLPKIFVTSPVLACDICCTLSWTMFLLLLHAPIAQM